MKFQDWLELRVYGFISPFVDIGFQLAELVRHPSDIIQYALCVKESFWLAELGAEVTEGFQLASFLFQLRSDLLKKTHREGIEQTSCLIYWYSLNKS